MTFEHLHLSLGGHFDQSFCSRVLEFNFFKNKISRCPPHSPNSPGLTLVAAINVGSKLSLSSSLTERDIKSMLSHLMTSPCRPLVGAIPGFSHKSSYPGIDYYKEYSPPVMNSIRHLLPMVKLEINLIFEFSL